MPIFEYICENCTTHFEELQWSSDSTKIVCPECLSEHVIRVLSSFSVSSAREQSLPSCASQKENGGCNGCAYARGKM